MYWEGIHDDITVGDHHYIPTIEEKAVSPHASPKYNKKRKQVFQAEPALTEEPPMQALQPLTKIKRRLGHQTAPHPPLFHP